MNFVFFIAFQVRGPYDHKLEVTTFEETVRIQIAIRY